MSIQSKPLVIIGAGGFCAEVVEAARAAGWSKFAIYDDDPAKHGTQILGIPCIGPVADVERAQGSPFIVAIGRNEIRQKIATRLEEVGLCATTVQHPSCVVSPAAKIANGAFLAPFCWVGPHVTIGRHALINASVSIGHDSNIGDWVQLCPGVRISGWVKLGPGAFLGSNAVVAPKASVGAWAQVAANSFAWRDVPPRKLAVGSPAKIVERP
jgi:sugar O-acyltransferase (sialic acid O-acetyltransferase NeuD family)